MSEQSSNCSEDRLRNLLQSDDDFGDDSQLAAKHIAECAYCQARLEQLAAEPDEWSEARESLISGDDHDEGRRAAMGSRPWARRRWQHRTTAWTESMSRQLLSPPSHPEMLGRIGRYEVERLIGAGGMGVVFKAFDTELNRPVAVKVLAPILAGSGAARQRFAREARAAAAVVHEHVVSIHNVETEGESPFLVMQYVAGESLQGRIDREGALEVCEILRISMQTAAGLAAAHAQGLVHRDVKPSNILLEKGVERALLTDFGLARASDDASLTHTGYHPGTPQYMSPEQARGDAVDSRSDLFSLGSVIYTMCTGRSPFRAETSYGILRRITDTEPRSIREINPNIPDWLESIVAKLMAKQADDRFAAADEVAELLEDCLAHVQQPTTVPLPESCRSLVERHNDHQRTAAGPRFPRKPPAGVVQLVMGAAAAFALIFAGILIVLELNKGTLTIESEIDNIPIRIMQGDRVVEQMTVTQAGTSTRVAAGKYVVEVENANDGFVVEGGTVSLMRGETRTVKIARNVRTGDGSSVRMPNEAIGSELDADFARRTTTINPDVPAQGKPVDKDKLLNELRERDRKFSRRSVELERTWDDAVSPQGMASEAQFQSMKFGQADPGIPQGLPEDYQQPHRIRYIWTGQNFESTLEILADLETALHPEHGKLASRTIESDCFNYQRIWNRDLKIFSHNSDIAKLCAGKKAWEYLLPSGFGFTPSILTVSNAVEVDDGYVLKGLISLPSATIGNRKNCFELQLDKDLILRRAVIQYHVYDFVIVTSGRSEFAGMPPLAKHAAVSIHHIGQDEKRSGDVGNYRYEVISLSERLSKDEYDLRVHFAIPKGTKLAAGLNVVEVNLQGLPGVSQIDRDQPALRPGMTPREDVGFPSDAVLQEMHDLLSEETRLNLDLRYVQQFLEGGKLFAKTDAAKTLENASRKEQIEARQQEITNRLKVIHESELGDLRRVAEKAGLECSEEPLYGQSSYGIIVYAQTLLRIQKDELLLFHAGSLYRTRETIRPLRTTGNGFFLRPNVAIPSGRHIAMSCIQDAEEERENVKNGFMPDSNRARNPSRAYRANVYDRQSGKLIQAEQAATNGLRAELAEIEEAWTQRSKDVSTSRLRWTENRIYPRGEKLSPNEPEPLADDLTIAWDKKLIIAGDKCRIEGIGKTWDFRVRQMAPFEFTAVRNKTGSSYHNYPDQTDNLGYFSESLKGLADVTYRPALLGTNPGDPDFGRIDLADYHVVPGLTEINGRKCIKLESNDNRSFDNQLFLDPERQFVVTRSISSTGAQVMRQLDLSYKQDSRAIWYPASWQFQMLNGNLDRHAIHITVVTAEFESDFVASPEDFEIQYRPGTLIYDQRTQGTTVKLRVQEDGSRQATPNTDRRELQDPNGISSSPRPPATDWNSTNHDLESYRIDLVPFESRSRLFWDDAPMLTKE